MYTSSRAIFLIIFTSLVISNQSLIAKDHIISFKGKSITTTVDFGISKIIDARAQKASIGYVYKGISPKKTSANFALPLEEELNNLFIAFPKEQQGRSYILRVNRLFIYEIITPNNTTAYAELNVSLLEQKGGNYVELLNIINKKERTGLDGTALHDNNIIDVLDDCLQYFEKRYQSDLLNEIVLGSDPFIIIERPEAKIMGVERIPKGIFRTYTDFKDFLLDETPFDYTKDYLEKLDAVVAELYTKEEKKIKRAWGFSDGIDLYINLGKGQYFRAVKRDGSYWVNHGKGKLNTALPILFGLAGAAMAATDNPDERGEKITSKLDFSTGNVIKDGESSVDKVEAIVYVSNSHYNKKEVILDISIDGAVHCQTQPGEYALVKIPANTVSIKLCINNSGAEVCETIYPEHFTNKVYLVRAKPNKQPKMTQLKGDTATEYFRKIEAGDLLEACP